MFKLILIEFENVFLDRNRHVYRFLAHIRLYPGNLFVFGQQLFIDINPVCNIATLNHYVI